MGVSFDNFPAASPRPRRCLALALAIGLVTSITANAMERLVFVKGHSIVDATLDSMIPQPGMGVVMSADLLIGFAGLAYEDDDILVHSTTTGRFALYRESEYFQSGILENATDYELFVYAPPLPDPIGLYEYVSQQGARTLSEVLDQPGAVVFYDMLVPLSGPSPGGDGGGSGDTIPPEIKLPANQMIIATSADGAVATFVVSVTDNADPAPTVSCDPMSGSFFTIGETAVTCTAMDASGNRSTGTFFVIVKLPLTPIADLAARARPGNVTLVWTPVPDAVSYNVYRRSKNLPFELIAEGHETDYATFSEVGLTNGVELIYMVRWVDEGGTTSPDSNEVSITPPEGRTGRR